MKLLSWPADRTGNDGTEFIVGSGPDEGVGGGGLFIVVGGGGGGFSSSFFFFFLLPR